MELEKVIRAYLLKRPYAGPFPPESAVMWAYLLGLQRLHVQRGDLLEIGVQYGTSAFMLAEHVAPGETCTLYDLRIEPIVADALDRSYSGIARQVRCEQADTMKLDAAAFRVRHPNLRWVHVDGGHLYRHVRNDIALTAPCVGEMGILVLDDVFEIRWPDVTRAAFDWLAGDRALSPLLFCGRKLYCCRTPDLEAQAARIKAHIRELDRVASVRFWSDVRFFENAAFLAIKLEPNADLFAAAGSAAPVS